MKEVSVTHVVVCPFCGKTGEVTITADGSGPRLVEMERVCKHADSEYEEIEEGVYIHFSDGERGDYVFLSAPLAVYVWRGDVHLVARALRRRGFKVRVHGRDIVFETPVSTCDVNEALRQYMLAAKRTVSYQFVRM